MKQNSEKKTGLVMEGGAMRGMFTCGVIDVFMEHGIEFDGAIGTSAGACFGCNYKSRQIGRAIRYNKNYCGDKRYASWWSLITTGDLYGADFCYRELPRELDVFDEDTFRENPMEFWVTCTDVHTGKAVYHRCDRGDDEDVLWMRASASMPMVSRPVKIGEQELLDGGMSDSIPLRKLEELGYNRNVVILTQPLGFVKEQNPILPLAKILLRKYPKLLRSFEHRPVSYNKTLAYIRRKEQEGELFVVRPPEALNIGSMEKDPAELERVYQIGRKTGEETVEKVREFLCSNN